ncbi:MAG: HDIG domain-containing metalloprotein [Eubacteriales bacterium]
MLSREESYIELKKYVKNKNLLKHMLSVEAVMNGLAEHFGEDKELWGLTGLLHDIDYDQTKDSPEIHSLKGAEILGSLDFPEDMIYAVKVHNCIHGLPRKSLLDKALYAADPVSGLVVAGALVKPDKKLENVDIVFLSKKFREKSFAKGANREQIKTCSELGLELEDFLIISLNSMKKIAVELEL